MYFNMHDSLLVILQPEKCIKEMYKLDAIIREDLKNKPKMAYSRFHPEKARLLCGNMA